MVATPRRRAPATPPALLLPPPALLLLLLLAATRCQGRSRVVEERLIGWKGEMKPDDPDEIEAAEQILRGVPTKGPKDPNAQWVQVLSWKPRAFIYHNFLSKAEIRHVLKLAGPQMKRSTVVGPNNTGVVDNIRTSAGTFLMRNQDPIITAIEQRLSAWSHLPPSFQEDMQVLRYGPTNKYGAHMDGLGRVMSVLIYLIREISALPVYHL